MTNPDPDRIYLQPDCCTDYLGEGRHWCQDNVWPTSSDCDKPGVEYVRADLAESAVKALSGLYFSLLQRWRRDDLVKSNTFGASFPAAEQVLRQQCPHGEPLNTCADCKREHLEATV